MVPAFGSHSRNFSREKAFLRHRVRGSPCARATVFLESAPSSLPAADDRNVLFWKWGCGLVLNIRKKQPILLTFCENFLKNVNFLCEKTFKARRISKQTFDSHLRVVLCFGSNFPFLSSGLLSCGFRIVKKLTGHARVFVGVSVCVCFFS